MHSERVRRFAQVFVSGLGRRQELHAGARAKCGPAHWVYRGQRAVHGLGGTGTSTAPVSRWLCPLATFAALALSVLICSEDADARPEDGLNLGRRDAFTFASSLMVVPAAEAPAVDQVMAANNGQPPFAGGSLGGLFNRPGLIGGFAAGFLGCGLLGFLFGQGMFTELGGVVSYLGLVFQVTLLAMLARVIWVWWHNENTTAATDLSPRQLADAYGRSRNELLPDIDPPATANVAMRETKEN